MSKLHLQSFTVSVEAAGHIKENIESTGLEDMVDEGVSSVLPTLVLYNIVRDFTQLYQIALDSGVLDTQFTPNNETIH